MVKRILFLLALTGLIAGLALAADISGKWTAQVPGRDGTPREQIFNFKVEGDKLTGTLAGGQGGDAPISEGKVSGDNISFVVVREFNGNTMKFTYTGVVAGDEIKMKREGGQGGQAREFVAKRAK
jgi:hypothetical protein